jgi:hypothetical protein
MPSTSTSPTTPTSTAPTPAPTTPTASAAPLRPRRIFGRFHVFLIETEDIDVTWDLPPTKDSQAEHDHFWASYKYTVELGELYVGMHPRLNDDFTSSYAFSLLRQGTYPIPLSNEERLRHFRKADPDVWLGYRTSTLGPHTWYERANAPFSPQERKELRFTLILAEVTGYSRSFPSYGHFPLFGRNTRSRTPAVQSTLGRTWVRLKSTRREAEGNRVFAENFYPQPLSSNAGRRPLNSESFLGHTTFAAETFAQVALQAGWRHSCAQDIVEATVAAFLTQRT